jgi:hypothetical protein
MSSTLNSMQERIAESGHRNEAHRAAPALIVTVDTEEEFDWSRPPAGQTPRVTHVAELARLQDLCEEAGARPTYVIDYPVLRDDHSADVLRAFAARGACELGAHLHPWVNPPVKESHDPNNTYLCNLPPALQEEKLATLVEAHRQAFGAPPRSFKAGRYGMDLARGDMLARHGFTVDASAVAYTDFSADGGPDFRPLDNQPFALDGLLEVPCSVAYTRGPQHRAHALHGWLARRPQCHLRGVGILWHTRLLRKVTLSPELHNYRDLEKALSALAGAGAPALQITLHSPSVVPGHTPYVRSIEDRDRLLGVLRRLIVFARERWGAISQTLTEFAGSYMRATP